MLKRICVTFLVVMLLSSIVYGEYILSENETSDSPDEDPTTPMIEPVTCMVISCVVVIIVGYFTTKALKCPDDPLSISVKNLDFEVSGADNDIHVGDYFKVVGNLSGYAGKDDHTNKVEIFARLGRGGDDWDWEQSAAKKFEDGSDFDIPFEFTDEKGRWFQASDTGMLVVQVKAKVTGYRGKWWCWGEKKETQVTDWFEVTRPILLPYQWSMVGPSRDTVHHPLSGESDTTTILTSKITNKSQATLKGELYIDDEKLPFSLGNNDYAELEVEKSHPCDIHPDTVEFYFENIELYSRIDLDSGYCELNESMPDDTIACCGVDTITSHADIITWGHVDVTPYPGHEGELLNFNFEIPGSEPTDVSYTWFFGDGDSAKGDEVTHTTYVYVENADPLIDTNSISVVDSADVGVSVSFYAEASDPGITDPLTFTWSFGDGDSAIGASVAHTYTAYGIYRYFLAVRDNHRGFDIASGVIWIQGQRPVADAGGPYTGNEGDSIKFDGSNSYDPDSLVGGKVTGWLWDFDDGTFGYGEKINHTYSEDGTYSAKLTVIDDNALASAQVSTQVTVNDVAPESLRVAFDYQKPSQVRFCADYDTPNPFDSLIYIWNFGDGNEATGQFVVHTYSSSKNENYPITLTVNDGDSPVYGYGQVSIPNEDTSSFNLGVYPSSKSVTAGGSATYDSVALTSINNFSDSCHMTTENLPIGAVGTFMDLRSEHPHAWMKLLVETQPTTPPGTHQFTVKGQSGDKEASAICTLTVTVPGAIPSHTQWGLFGLMLVLLAIATWVFFLRRRAVRSKIS